MRSERAWLEKNGVGDSQLTDVVKVGSSCNPVELLTMRNVPGLRRRVLSLFIPCAIPGGVSHFGTAEMGFVQALLRFVGNNSATACLLNLPSLSGFLQMALTDYGQSFL